MKTLLHHIHFILYLFLDLQKNIINIPNHIFGQQTLCEQFFVMGQRAWKIVKYGLMNEMLAIYSLSLNR